MILHNVDKHVIKEEYLPAVSFSKITGHSPLSTWFLSWWTDYYQMQLDGVMKVTVENHDKVAIL